ncbi:ABC-2 type transporter [Xylanimonas cellulosilytica DSM 15894]|uniref:Transport permease protein n=1 Tax=Xylanimonas cellulosilytica (strain DSM 15894 / JCM 12276 / CECT 5975 / KCTC 9989 / LMG 20990 / NBRC 107835 / XIL07) TaxID=446471 RepID=D1BVI6_XYLCX|nr:ABC transporter permease [Xylanimonas cellulosilytica]ACZ29457.1 ABC-2 type transporter [Xylanimonas cellulosilytica DSM 15894]
MSLTLATAGRVLGQLRHDRRTVALIMVLPCLIVGLVAWMFDGTPVLDQFGPVLVGFFPLFVMFLVTSVTTQRERASGTLERLMTTPIRKGEFVAGYALAFGALAAVQAVVVVGFALLVGMDVAGSLGLVLLVALLDAVLGCTLGLAASAAARTEFQAVQMMPAVIIPQLVTAGILLPRDQMPEVLEWISRVLPLTYAVESLQQLAAGAGWADVRGAIAVVVVWIVGAGVLGVLTLRRRTE